MNALRCELRKTSLGWLVVIASARGLRWVSLSSTRENLWHQVARRFPEVQWKPGATSRQFLQGSGVPERGFAQWVEQVVEAVERPAQARRLPLDITGTPFQKAVWDLLCDIPAGSVLTYGELASRAGHPRAARAAGSACGANPIPFIIPCHRVVAAQGRLGGFGLGLDVKRALLAREGVAV